jgi:hypothetical protein
MRTALVSRACRRSFRSACARRRRQTTPIAVELLEERVLLSAVYRSIDGTGNNLQHSDWGSAGTQLLRNTTVAYGDGISSPAGADRPNPRLISNLVLSQTEDIFNDRHLTQFIFQWGQFLDHDMDLTEEAHPFEFINIPVPIGDPQLDPDNTGTQSIMLFRSRYDTATGTSTSNPRQQINQITSYLDGSNVYGSDAVRAAALRTFVGGKLKTSDGNLLPYNTSGQPNASPPPLDAADYFLAGDIRANEQPGLTSLHTLFMREHNRLAAEIAAKQFKGKNLANANIDESIYQQARRIVIAEIQSITYREFLPALLGQTALGSYAGYDPSVNPGIANVFSAALYRVGHTMLPLSLTMMNDDLSAMGPGQMGLGDAFFQPSIVETFGIDPFLMGLGASLAQEIDSHIVDGVRNLLFDPPAQSDLAAINIQRGRDHGLPGYNQTRRDFGLESYTSFSQITSDPNVAAALSQAYGGDIEKVDLWVGAISEDHMPGCSVGELIQAALVDQFRRLRDGDRFFYENQFSGAELAAIQNTTLADIIRCNTGLTHLQDNMFFDRSVLFYQAPAGTSGANLFLDANGNWLRLFDLDTGKLLVKRLIGETSQVILVGNDGSTDRFVIDVRGARGSLPGGVIVHGGDAGEDLLAIFGSPHDDVSELEDGSVQVGNVVFTSTGIERLFVLAGPGSGFVNRLHGKGSDHGRGPDGRQLPPGKPETLASTLPKKSAASASDVRENARSKTTPSIDLSFGGALERVFAGSLLDQLL